MALSKQEVGLNEASRIYGVPKATLKRRFDDKNAKAKGEKQIVGSEEDLTPDLKKKTSVSYFRDGTLSIWNHPKGCQKFSF